MCNLHLKMESDLMSALALSKKLAECKLDLKMEKRELISALDLSMELAECMPSWRRGREN